MPNYLVRISSTGNNLQFIRPDLSATSTISGSTVSIVWYQEGNHFKIKDLLGVAGKDNFVVLTGGQVCVGPSPSTNDPYKFSVSGNSSMSGNLIVNGTISANSLYFQSTTSIEIIATASKLDISGEISVTSNSTNPIFKGYDGTGDPSTKSISIDYNGDIDKNGNFTTSGQGVFKFASQLESENLILQSQYSASSIRVAALKFNLPDDPLHTTNRRAYIAYGYSDFTSGNEFIQKIYRGLTVNAAAGDINISTESNNTIDFLTYNDVIPKLRILASRNISVSADLNLSGNLKCPARVRGSTTSGIVYLGTSRAMHFYYPVSGGFGENLFIGSGAGNFTTSGQLAYEAGANIGVGASTLAAIKNGYGNIAIGVNSQLASTSGIQNISIGSDTLTKITTAANNVAVGDKTGRYTTGQYNVLIGAGAGNGVDGSSTFNFNVFLGFQVGNLCTTGSGNMIMGYWAGKSLVTGNDNMVLGIQSASSLTSGSRNIVIGGNQQTTSITSNDEMNIGGLIYGNLNAGKRNVGIAISPTAIGARLHLPAGSTGSLSAPLKFTNGRIMTTAEAGAIEFEDEKFYFTPTSATRQNIPGVLFSQTASVTADATNSNDITITGGGIGTMTLNSGYFVPGKTLRLTLAGYSVIVGDITSRVKVKISGSTFVETAEFNRAIGTNKYWELSLLMTCSTTGSSGIFYGQGKFSEDNSAGTFYNIGMVSTSGARINTTSTVNINVTNSISSGSSSDKVICTNLLLESLN